MSENLELSQMAGQAPQYGVLRPTIMGGEPDRIDSGIPGIHYTRELAEREVAAWRARGQRAYVVIREWELLHEGETQPAREPVMHSVQCGWCDDYARGSGFYASGKRWYPSCGRVLHGLSFEASRRWLEP